MGPGLRIRRRLGHCCLLLCCLPALAPAQQLSLRYHTAAEGLGNLGVNALVKEPDGALWIGTENGLYRHDGASIQRADGFSSQMIHSMVLGADGALWVGSRTGLHRRVGGKPLGAPVGDAATWSVRRGQSLAALSDGGVLVVGLEGTLWRVSTRDGIAAKEAALPPSVVAENPAAGDVRSILVTRDGAWWFGCGQALCSWQAGRFTRLGAADGVAPGEWLGLLQTRDGALWARTASHVLRRRPGAAHFADHTPEGLRQGSTYRWLPLSEDLAGRVLTSGDEGVFRWEAGRWRYFGSGQGLTEDGIRAMLADRDGNVWLSTTGHGLVQWRGYAEWQSWTVRQGLPSDMVWSIADDGAGRLWIGTARGVASHDGAGESWAREAPRVTGQVGSMVADGHGGMWLSTFGGDLYHGRHGGPWRAMANGGRLLAVDGELWIAAADRGLFTTPLDGSGVVKRRDELDRLLTGSDRRVNTACRVKGSDVVWLGTGGGLLQFDPVRGFTRPQVAGLSADNGVAYLACGAGRVWLRTVAGQHLLRIDLARAGALRAEPMPTALLKDRRVYSLLEDHRGWLWAGTDAGVVRWNGRDWRRFDESNGLSWNDCNQGALAEDAQGAIWVGTSRGASRIADPERLGSGPPLKLRLTQARQGERQLVAGRRTELPWSTLPLELRWEVPLFSNRLAQHTRYRLRGRDDAWTDIRSGELRYAGLGPGRYSLELVAVNDDLGQSSEPLVLEFDILPPWWQSQAVRGAAAAAFLLLIYTAYRLRIRRLMQQQNALEAQVQERERMASRLEESQLLLRRLAALNEDAREDERRHIKREIHDELGQYLSALRLGIAVVDMQLADSQSPLREKTQRLIGVVDATIQVVRNVVASLRPSALELGIVSALEWLATEYCERTSVRCELRISEADIDMDDKRATAVFRIVQESLSNISRHAQATQVKISLGLRQDSYVLEVSDNGLGFDPELRKDKSFGLVSIRERVLMLGGTIRISSVPGRTVIRVRFPVHAASAPGVGVS